MDDKIKAKRWLIELREPGDDIDAEIKAIYKANEANMQMNSITWSDVFEWKKAVELGVMLMIIQTQTGANSIFYYSSTIFGFAGFDDAILGTVIVNGVNLAVTVLSAGLVDKMGRKVLLMGGTYAVFFSLLTLSLVLWFGDSLGSTQGVIAVLAVVVFVIGWGIGLGAVAWVVLTEIIPTHIRSKAYSLFVSAMWLNSFLVGFLTLTAIDGLGGAEASQDDTTKTQHQKTGCGILYFIYTVFCAFSLLYMHYELPETKGLTAEEMRPARETLTEGDGVHNPMYGDNANATTNANKNTTPKKKLYKGSSQGLQESLITAHEL